MDQKYNLSTMKFFFKFTIVALPLVCEILGAIYGSLDVNRSSNLVYPKSLWISISTVILLLRIPKSRVRANTRAWISSELMLIYASTKAFFQSESTTVWVMLCALIMNSQANFYKSLRSYAIKQGILIGIYSVFQLAHVDLYSSADRILPFMLVYTSLLFNYSKNKSIRTTSESLNSKLQETTQQFEATINAISVGIVVINSAHKPLIYNSSMLSMFQLSHPHEIFTTVAGMSFRSESDNFTKWSGSNRLVDYIHHFLTIDDSTISLGVVSYKSQAIEIRVSKITWEGTTAILITTRDVTQLLELEFEKTQSNFKSCLLRTVSHELRTPTNGILGMMELIKEDLLHKLSIKNQHRLDIAIKSCKHLLLLINDLLDYSQIVAGTLSMSCVPFKLKQFLNDCLSLVEFGAKDRNIDLRVEIEMTAPKYILSDPNRLSQIILNLLSNALKFTMSGSITIKVTRINIEKLAISVQDTGIGIPKNRLSQMFQAFGRIDDAMHNKLNPLGCGLGLHISNMLVQYLRGDPISLSSIEGKGSTFTITLPIDQDYRKYETQDLSLIEDSSIKIPVSLTSINKNPFISKCPSVLIVDDSYFNCLVISQILETMHLSTKQVMNGQQALAYLTEHSTHSKCLDIIILDYELPDITGPEIASSIYSQYKSGSLNYIPAIIAASASYTEETLQEWQSAGVSDFLQKPCSIETLREKIEAYTLAHISSESALVVAKE